MKTTYVFDTSTLINDPSAYNQFHDSNVIIPIFVLNELDKLKKQPAEVGRNARVAIRKLDEICLKGDISTGILLDNDVLLSIDATYRNLLEPEFAGFGDPSYGDTQILACAYAHWRLDNDTVLVSNDINLRVKALSRGMLAESYDVEGLSSTDLYSGVQSSKDEEAGLALQQLGYIDPADYELSLSNNECISFETDSDVIAIGRKVSDSKIKLIKKFYPWNINPRNTEQTLAIDLIMDPNVDLITLIGKAGSGKSLIALATALELVLNKKEYDKLIIYRPIQPVGNDIGFTPGTIAEKLAPWFQAIMDSFELLFSTKNSTDWKKNLEMYQKKGRIEMEAITYVRGRSIPNAIILLDEAQNLNKEDIKTILTRAGENTKIIITGDIEQIDNSKLDATNNGLTYVIDKFKDSEIAGHITLTKGERSRLASEASRIL